MFDNGFAALGWWFFGVFSNVNAAAVAAGPGGGSSVVAFDTSSLSGPLGGALALAFAGGAVAGYGFCVRTILKISNSRIAALEDDLKQEKADCRSQMDSLIRRQRELEDMLLGKRPLGFFSETLRPVSDPHVDDAIRQMGEDRGSQRNK